MRIAAARRGAILAALAVAAGACQVDDRLNQSRRITGEFQQALGARLQAAMVNDGPVEAIRVCAEQAPAIAAQFSEQSAAVGRTALRVRNPDNAPDEHARAVMQTFQQRLAAGAEPPFEDFSVAGDGSARYLRAIVMQPLCTTCHGRELAPAVAEAVAARYRNDAATGFEVGELRGAFTVDWPAGGSD